MNRLMPSDIRTARSRERSLNCPYTDRVIAPGDSGYDDARTVFMGGFDRRPAVIVRPKDTDGAHTPREREVALFVVDGRSDREIAERLSLSHHMVSQYVKRV